ncbi:uncharacterized protein M421DRAFT_387818 [Didymella exigua CBS 183.55]|uniref:Uncharacterized protein n=1 Tax=Didymella exigua CBS 183.55 TaxID=1150837 RepID=A0A6A5R2B4_9PLEO|nr:uncharacterized protein M421DRAFT_387818 [Didymella exigua CBS 183.55]KAF1922215.1 hypothetical protein M421DRAFT_387818 [Didymella exigua CBS 183.55]
MDKEEVNTMLVSNNKDNIKEVSNKAKQSPYTARALRFTNLEVCTGCALEGFACTFSRDAYKRGAKVRKSACDVCAQKQTACIKLPCKTFSTLVKYKVASCVSKKPLHLLKYSAPVRLALEKRMNLPKHAKLDSYPRSSYSGVAGYNLKWSNYKEEINAILACPYLEVKFTKRTTLACEEIL